MGIKHQTGPSNGLVIPSLLTGNSSSVTLAKGYCSLSEPCGQIPQYVKPSVIIDTNGFGMRWSFSDVGYTIETIFKLCASHCQLCANGVLDVLGVGAVTNISNAIGSPPGWWSPKSSWSLGVTTFMSCGRSESSVKMVGDHGSTWFVIVSSEEST